MKKYIIPIIMLLTSIKAAAMIITPISSKDVNSSVAQYLDMETLQGLINQTCYEFSSKGCRETGAFVIKSNSKITSITSQGAQALAIISSPKNDLLTRLSCLRTKPNEETIVAGCPTTITTDASYLWETQNEKEKIEISNDDVIVIPLNLKENKQQEKPEEKISITVTNEDGSESTSVLPNTVIVIGGTPIKVGINNCWTTECGTWNHLVYLREVNNVLVGINTSSMDLKIKSLHRMDIKITGNRYLINTTFGKDTSECPSSPRNCIPFKYYVWGHNNVIIPREVFSDEWLKLDCDIHMEDSCNLNLDIRPINDLDIQRNPGKYHIANASRGYQGRPVLHVRDRP